MWEKAAKREEKKVEKTPQFTLLDRNFTVAACCWGDWLCSLKSESRKKKDHSGVVGLAPLPCEEENENESGALGLAPAMLKEKEKEKG